MGDRLGQYELDKRIGAGGMADVFLARGPQGVCVIKRPHPNLCASPEFVRMFLDEAALLAQLHHPGIAQIFDLGHINGVYFLAMEYVPGFDLMTISLEHERQGELMPCELAGRIIADAAEALHHAHEAVGRNGKPLNLIHRDVTPHNILLSTQGLVKLIDFGVARAASATHRTQAGLVKGKYAYMSPEQITGQTIDRRVDVYALGLCLYELLTNVRAIPGDNELEQIDAARSARIRPVRQLRPNIPEGLELVINTCLQPNVATRYSTALDVKNALELWLRNERYAVGREDLLRLFRVVAAEVAQLGPLPDGVKVESQGYVVPPGPEITPEEIAVGAARTHPSFKRLAGPETDKAPAHVPGRPIPLTAEAPVDGASKTEQQISSQGLRPTEPEAPATPHKLQPVMPIQLTQSVDSVDSLAPAPSRGPMLALLAVLGLAGVAAGVWLVLRTPVLDAQVVDAGVHRVAQPVVDAGSPTAELQVDAGAEPLLDAGTMEVAAPDAGSIPVADLRAAVVPVSSDPPTDVFVDGSRYGKTPIDLELSPGTHLIRLTNREQEFTVVRKVTLKPGDRKPLLITGAKGTLVLKANPFARFTVDDKLIGVTSFKELQLWEGNHTVEAAPLDENPEKPNAKKAEKRVVPVKAGKTIEASFNLLQ